MAGAEATEGSWSLLLPEMLSKIESRRNILVSSYLLVLHSNFLPVAGVNLPVIQTLTLEGTGRDLIANSSQSCEETNVVSLFSTGRFPQEEKLFLPPPWGRLL